MTDDEWDAFLDRVFAAGPAVQQRLIRGAVADAVAAEREACARLADETNQWIGHQIRAREETP